MFSVIVPSCNEENDIGACLEALRRSEGLDRDHGIQIVVAANGCHDRTVAVAQNASPGLEGAGFSLVVIDLPEPGKIGALNAGDNAATWPARAYLDADVEVGPSLLADLATALSVHVPRYVSGSPIIPRPRSPASRAFARIWTNLPFFRDGAPGVGLYAVTAAGRERWGAVPGIIRDDRYVRLLFAPDERVRLAATYRWPLPEGFSNLLRVRRRWIEGNVEIAHTFPQLMVNDSQRNRSASSLSTLARAPLSGIVYLAVFAISAVQVRFGARASQWRRGRS